MNTRAFVLASLVSLSLFVLASCSKGMKAQETETVVETADGAAVVDTVRIDATVTAIDPARRTVTLTGSDGGRTTAKAGQGTDLSKLKVGDKVSATLTEAIAVYLRKSGTPSVGEADTVALAARGHSDTVLVADAVEMSAKVTSVDLKTRKMTLRFADGHSRTLKTGKKIDLTGVRVGDEVVARIAEAVALTVVSK